MYICPRMFTRALLISNDLETVLFIHQWICEHEHESRSLPWQSLSSVCVCGRGGQRRQMINRKQISMMPSNQLRGTKEIKQGDGIDHVWRCRGGKSKRAAVVPGAMGNASLEGDTELRSEWWQRTSSANASPETQRVMNKEVKRMWWDWREGPWSEIT